MFTFPMNWKKKIDTQQFDEYNFVLRINTITI